MTATRQPWGATPPPRGAAFRGNPTQGCARLVRIVGLGGASLTLAGVAHLSGGGQLPGLTTLLLLLIGTGTVAALVTARQCRLSLLLPLVGAGQIILHGLFTGGSATSCTSSSAVPAAHVGTFICHSSFDAAQSELAHHQPFSLIMLCGHVLAAALTAWVLARGERALWRLAERIVGATRPTLTSWPPHPSRGSTAGTLPALTASVHCDDAPPRGPPPERTAVS